MAPDAGHRSGRSRTLWVCSCPSAARLPACAFQWRGIPPNGAGDRPARLGWSRGCHYRPETPLGWPGRSHGPCVSSVGVKHAFPIRATVPVVAGFHPGQPAVLQMRHPHPAHGHDRLSRDDSRADRQRHLQQPKLGRGGADPVGVPPSHSIVPTGGTVWTQMFSPAFNCFLPSTGYANGRCIESLQDLPGTDVQLLKCNTLYNL